jgi:hypothetical protein
MSWLQATGESDAEEKLGRALSGGGREEGRRGRSRMATGEADAGAHGNGSADASAAAALLATSSRESGLCPA